MKPNHVKKIIVSSAPYERFKIDLTELSHEMRLNHRYKLLLTMINHFSKFAWAVPFKNKTGSLVASKTRKLLTTLSRKPEIMQSDNDSEFICAEFTSMLSDLNIKQIRSSPYNPRAQGCVENFNKYIKRNLILLSIGNKNDADFRANVRTILAHYNYQRVHTMTKHKPVEIIESDDQRMFESIAQEVTASRYARLVSEQTFSVGQKVQLPNILSLYGKEWLKRRHINLKYAHYRYLGTITDINCGFLSVKLDSNIGKARFCEIYKISSEDCRVISEENFINLKTH